MDCTKCDLKGCRNLSPCKDDSAEYIDEYLNSENADYIKFASALVDNGNAGKLNRLEEIVEYCRLRNYKKIGVAFCYSMDKEAVKLKEYLEVRGFRPAMVSCSVDGLSAKKINADNNKDSLSCNPVGQAKSLNKSGVDFTIIMGLYLGHDMIFQKQIKTDFTTFAVKDRVLSHNPLSALYGGKSAEDLFIEKLADDFNLIKSQELKEKISSEKFSERTYILDLRNETEYLSGHIQGAINCLLKELPEKYGKILPEKDKEVIIYCNGGIQSVYAVMFLAIKGYIKVKSLTGGYSRYKEI